MSRFDELPKNIDREASFSFVLPSRITQFFGVRDQYTLSAGGIITWTNDVKYTYEGRSHGSPVFRISRPSKYGEEPILSIETITEEDFLCSLCLTDVGINYLQTSSESPIEIISVPADWPLREAGEA